MDVGADNRKRERAKIRSMSMLSERGKKKGGEKANRTCWRRKKKRRRGTERCIEGDPFQRRKGEREKGFVPPLEHTEKGDKGRREIPNSFVQGEEKETKGTEHREWP